ncbi:MAG: FadR family transcriptional regulator [Myxococcales bacterium]|nr:FadR family transcriptional regulator [Myxococcales bacterium]
MHKAAKQTLDEDLFEELRRQILAGHTPPGGRLPPERELAAHYGTNRNTLREAVRRLEQARLVSVRQGQGVTVRDFRRSATIDILEAFLEHGPDATEKVRCVADLLAARATVLEYVLALAFERASADDVVRLGEVTDLLRAAFEARDRATLARGYTQWLDALIDAAHSLPARWIANPFLDANRSLMARFPELWVLDEGFADYLVATRDALGCGDLESALAAHRAYYGRVDGAILAALETLVDAGLIGVGSPGPSAALRARTGSLSAVASSEAEEGR